MKDAFGNLQRALLLGGGSDIGLAIVERLVTDHGVTEVILAGRSPERFTFDHTGVTTRKVGFDATKPTDHDTVFTEMFADGDIDVVVVAFGVLIREQGVNTEPAAVLDMLETNYVGAVSALIHAGRRLAAQGHGHLIVISSVAGQRARPDNYLYGSTRAALDFVARGMIHELSEAGVGITILRPGFVHSKMTAGWKPAPFSSTPSQVAKAAVSHLDRSDGTIVWVPGALFALAVVIKLLPSPLLRRLSSARRTGTNQA